MVQAYFVDRRVLKQKQIAFEGEYPFRNPLLVSLFLKFDVHFGRSQKVLTPKPIFCFFRVLRKFKKQKFVEIFAIFFFKSQKSQNSLYSASNFVNRRDNYFSINCPVSTINLYCRL